MEKVQMAPSSNRNYTANMTSLSPPSRARTTLSALLSEDLSTTSGFERSPTMPLHSMDESICTRESYLKILDTIDTVLMICDGNDVGDLEPTIMPRGCLRKSRHRGGEESQQ